MQGPWRKLRVGAKVSQNAFLQSVTNRLTLEYLSKSIGSIIRHESQIFVTAL